MKQLNVCQLGVEELTLNEELSIDGGFPWIVFGVAFVVGMCISCPTAAAEYYGGELEPALCQA